MKILVVGSGAREHALAWKLAQSRGVEAVFAAPGNAGTAALGTNWPDLTPTMIPAIVAKATAEKIDLVVVGPEAALAAGIADALRAARIVTFGPGRAGARLESSKAFAKQFMVRWGIPTARFFVAHDHKQARNVLRGWPQDRGAVLKADGLAAGKGVVVCDSPDAAQPLADEWYAQQKVPGGGSTVVIEEKLEGREVSMMAVVDGRRAVMLAPARDYKRAGDGDTGPNTGGMGAYSPVSDVDSALCDRITAEIFMPALSGLQRESIDFRGCLYAGLIVTSRGPHVLEFNARFGDPETQVLMPRLDGDLARLLLDAASQNLEEGRRADFSPQACVGVVMASEGYPQKTTPVDNLPPINGLRDESVAAFWGASRLVGAAVSAAGGRVITICATAADRAQARAAAYAACDAYAARLPAGTKLWRRSDIAR